MRQEPAAADPQVGNVSQNSLFPHWAFDEHLGAPAGAFCCAKPGMAIQTASQSVASNKTIRGRVMDGSIAAAPARAYYLREWERIVTV